MKKINKFLASAIVLTNLTFQCGNSLGFAIDPVKLENVQSEEISKVRASFAERLGSDSDFEDTDIALSHSYVSSVKLKDGKTVCFMVLNAPKLMDGLDVPSLREHIKKSKGDTIVSHMEKKFKDGYNLLHILACLRNDSYIMFNELTEKYDRFDNGFKKEMDSKLTKLLTSAEYDKYYQQVYDFMGGKIKKESIKEVVKSLILSAGISQSAFQSAWKGQALALASWVAGAVCPILLPVTLPLSFKAGTMIRESDMKVEMEVEQQKLSNLESILSQILHKICDDKARIANTNALLIVFDDRSDVRINNGGILKGFASLFVPTVYTVKDNRGADVEFRCVKNLKNAPKMIEYKRNGKSLFSVYAQIFQRLMEHPDDMPTLTYIRDYLTNGTNSPAKQITDKKVNKSIKD